ncbi:AraC family transcriptional regulator [Microbispora sp. CA-135349]|uniref:AraC family transcriptional regulator n=1 Tax=Microbispora sp. CA-135349 TaxID=3239953 RepID=UPI003D929358
MCREQRLGLLEGSQPAPVVVVVLDRHVDELPGAVVGFGQVDQAQQVGLLLVAGGGQAPVALPGANLKAANLDRRQTVDELAHRAHVSRRTFIRRFHQETDTSPMARLIAARVDWPSGRPSTAMSASSPRTTGPAGPLRAPHPRRRRLRPPSRVTERFGQTSVR